MGNLKNENSCTKQEPISPDRPSVLCEIKKNSSSSNFEVTHSLATPGLSLPPLKFEDNGDIGLHSPDYSMWESIFSDQLEDDPMICSPVRNMPSNYTNYTPAIPGEILEWFSPPRFSSPRKGKGLSPLSKVFNSPNNQFMQIEQVESFSMQSLENLLVDSYDNKGDDFAIYPQMKLSNGGELGSTYCYGVPELLECLDMPNSMRFSGDVVSDEGSSQVTQESGVYQQVESVAPLSQQLQQERQLDRQQKQQLPPPTLQRQHQQQLHQQNQLQNLQLMVPVLAPEQEQDSGLQLVHLLLACAEAVSKEDYMLARRYLHHLNRVVSPLGDSMQRVAACFTDALTARLAATLTNKPSASNSKRFNPFPPDNLEILKIYQILYQACPYIKFAHFTANQAIFEAFEAEERVHVIDLDILQGYQWPAFMQALAARPGGAPFLRITGVGPSPEAVRETGRCLTELANSLHIPFDFHPVGEELEDLKPHMFNRRVGEALAVNSVNRLHRVPGNCLGNLLAMIRDQAPNIVTIVEQEASHNGPYFLGRFLEALHYYSAIFDSLDATFPPDSAQRAKVEQHILAPEIRHIVAEEGAERVLRHERLEKWRKIMEGKGFQGVPLSSNAVTQSKILLGLYSCDGYRLTEDKGCLLLGWQDRSLLAASAWRC
ncbi:hypothetical protein CDL12_07931 [Handroanthus impetiginosus]|uniref:Uncharacterized protein n=1 Tax=Handroanthus impetiginosus TaxID=429701 RepID=A0A2G9HPL0_9LAMI|nr:hypothetical protein CDL12_07931 [Handroanthus impetiginosus]